MGTRRSICSQCVQLRVYKEPINPDGIFFPAITACCTESVLPPCYMLSHNQFFAALGSCFTLVDKFLLGRKKYPVFQRVKTQKQLRKYLVVYKGGWFILFGIIYSTALVLVFQGLWWPLLPPVLAQHCPSCGALPDVATVLPVPRQSCGCTRAHSPHCRAAGSGPAPLSYPSLCLGAIHFAVIEFLWRVIFIQRASQHLWILIAFLHKEKAALCQ